MVNYSGVKTSFRPIHVTIIQIIVIVGLVVTAIGASRTTSGSTTPTTSKVSYGLYFASLAAIIGVWAMAAPSQQSVPSKERHIVPIIGILLPLVTVRLVYSACAVFLSGHARIKFGTTGNSILLWVTLAVWEEILITAVFVCLGFSLEKLPKDQKESMQSRCFALRRGRR